MAFSLTHNPVFQFCTGPLVAMIGPFIAGMVAAGRAQTRALEALLFAVAISVSTTSPLLVAWIWLVFNAHLVFGPFALNRSEVPVLGWITAGVALYVLVTAFAGALYGARRQERKSQRASSLVGRSS
ncbi:MAG: hypothetical protein U0556_11740 [Dehalococcoidia bacterium]